MKLKEMTDDELLKLLREVSSEKKKLKEELKRSGDIHLINIHRFFSKWVDKSHPLRSAIKNIVFGM